MTAKRLPYDRLLCTVSLLLVGVGVVMVYSSSAIKAQMKYGDPLLFLKKQLLWAEWLREKLLAPVLHRHVVLTMPRLLRPLFRRRGASFLGELSQAGAGTSTSPRRPEQAWVRMSAPASSSPSPPPGTFSNGIPTFTS